MCGKSLKFLITKKWFSMFIYMVATSWLIIQEYEFYFFVPH